MTDHYDEMSVRPDPVPAEELRQRLHTLIAVSLNDRGGRPHLRTDPAGPEPEQHLVPVKERYMSAESPTNDTRNRRGLAMAAAAIVAVIGVIGIVVNTINSDDDVDPLDTPLPTTIVAPRTQIGYFTGEGEDVPVTFIVPDGWEVLDDGWGLFTASGAGVNFYEVTDLYSDSCQWVLVDPPVGPSVDDLVEAWANLPSFNATPPADVTVDGYVGKQIEFTVPDYNAADCKELKFALWQEADSLLSSPSFWAQGPHQHTVQRILSVDGARLVITTLSFPDTPPQDLAAIDQILATLQIG